MKDRIVAQGLSCEFGGLRNEGKVDKIAEKMLLLRFSTDLSFSLYLQKAPTTSLQKISILFTEETLIV